MASLPHRRRDVEKSSSAPGKSTAAATARDCFSNHAHGHVLLCASLRSTPSSLTPSMIIFGDARKPHIRRRTSPCRDRLARHRRVALARTPIAGCNTDLEPGRCAIVHVRICGRQARRCEHAAGLRRVAPLPSQRTSALRCLPNHPSKGRGGTLRALAAPRLAARRPGITYPLRFLRRHEIFRVEFFASHVARCERPALTSCRPNIS
jgi:hypothetical protein